MIQQVLEILQREFCLEKNLDHTNLMHISNILKNLWTEWFKKAE